MRVSVVVSVAATDTTTTDYPGDKVTLPPATTGRPVRAQATQGTPRVRGGQGWAGVGRGGPWEATGGAPKEGLRGLRGGGGHRSGAHANQHAPLILGGWLPVRDFFGGRGLRNLGGVRN